MGEYVKHPNIKTSEEVKIGVCIRGDMNFETFFNKDMLEELRFLGFNEYYGGEYVEVNDILDIFIDNYNTFDKRYMQYTNPIEITVQEDGFNSARELMLEEDIALTLLRGNKEIIISDKKYVDNIGTIMEKLGIENFKISEYKFQYKQ